MNRIAVLVSGSGSNLQALLDACVDGRIGAKIALVISNKAGVYALERAAKAGVKTVLLSHKDYASREAYDAALQTVLTEHQIDFICLAGFMRLLTAEFTTLWQGKMLNIHPSLLPAFKGAHAVRDALAAGVKVTGCTVHYVTAEMDAGPIVVQKTVPVLEDDTVETLSSRIHALEHLAYVEAVAGIFPPSS